MRPRSAGGWPSAPADRTRSWCAPVMVAAMVAAAAAADGGGDGEQLAGAKAQHDLDPAVGSKRPFRAHHHEMQAGRREGDAPMRRNRDHLDPAHLAHAVLDRRSMQLDALVVRT